MKSHCSYLIHWTTYWFFCCISVLLWVWIRNLQSTVLSLTLTPEQWGGRACAAVEMTINNSTLLEPQKKIPSDSTDDPQWVASLSHRCCFLSQEALTYRRWLGCISSGWFWCQNIRHAKAACSICFSLYHWLHTVSRGL